MEYVDLGLSVKWASCNLGADEPEIQGSQKFWGVTKENYYNLIPALSRLIEDTFSIMKIDKNGVNNKDLVLNPLDDAAHSILGGSWRMPTYNEFNELYRLCIWRWLYKDGSYGYQVKSLIEGYKNQSIFLPVGQYGRYWSSTYYKKGSFKARGLSIDSYNASFGCGDVRTAMMIRPVCP